jgi:phospholipid transport system transporter-binding protein
VIERSGGGLQVSGDVTMATVSALFNEGLKFQESGGANNNLVVDFAGLEKVDSSAVSLMLVWMREAGRNKATLHFSNVPGNLMSLAKLYGVAELLPLSAAQ